MKPDILNLIKNEGGILLDIACGASKQHGWVGLDIQPIPGVDIVHDLNIHPWPLPDECAIRAKASHIIEHIPPVAISDRRGTWFPFLEFMDEVWRVLKYDGEFMISCPHGNSQGQLQDPTHCHALNEMQWAYFDPLVFDGLFYSFYRPKPWRIKQTAQGEPILYWSPQTNIEVVLEKRRIDQSYGVKES